MIAGIVWYIGKVIALATVTLAAVLLISSTEPSIPDLFVIALVWVAVAAQDAPSAGVSLPPIASLPYAVQTAHPNGGETAVPVPPLKAHNTPPFLLLTEPALPDAEVPLFVIPTLEPEAMGEGVFIVIPPLQDVVMVIRRIVHVLQVGL